MAVFSVEIADEDVARVLDAVAANYNRPEQVPNPDYDADATIPNPDFDPDQPTGPGNEENIPDPSQNPLIDNPENTAQFCNRIVRQFLAEHVSAHELKLAKEQAAANVDSSVTINDPQL